MSSSLVIAVEACQSWSLLWCIVNDARVSSLSARYELLRTNSLKGLSLMLVRMFTKQVRICPLELNASYLLDWGATLTWSAWFDLNTWSHVWFLVLDKLCVFMRGLETWFDWLGLESDSVSTLKGACIAPIQYLCLNFASAFTSFKDILQGQQAYLFYLYS